MRVEDKPKIRYIPVEQPSGRGQTLGQDRLGGAEDAKAKPDAPNANVMGEFGKTSDQTDDINPLTSKKSRISDGKESLQDLKLPSEGGGNSPFQAMDEAFHAAGDAMEAGMDAQAALGMQGPTRFEAVEEPGGAPAIGDPDLTTGPGAPTLGAAGQLGNVGEGNPLLDQVTAGRDSARLAGNHAAHGKPLFSTDKRKDGDEAA